MATFLKNILKSEKQSLFSLFFLALVLRCVYSYIRFSAEGTSGFKDAALYLSLGEHMAAGNWELINSADNLYMFVAPWIPFMAAFFFAIFGTAVIPMIIYSLIVGSLSVPALYYFGKEIYNKQLGYGMAVWGAVHYTSFGSYPTVLKEPTLLLLFPLVILFLLRSLKNNFAWRSLVLSALFFAILIHTDERFFTYYLFLPIAFLVTPGEKVLSGLKPAALWMGIVLFLMLPWSIRNYKVFDQVVIIAPRTTIFTSKLWGENIMQSNLLDESRAAQEAINRAAIAEAFAKKHGLTIKERSKREAQLMAFVHFWQPTYFKPTFKQYGYRPISHNLRGNIAHMALFGVFLPFYVFGLGLLMYKKKYHLFLISCIPIIHSLIHAYMIWPLKRYRLPIEFIVVMVGIWAAIELYNIIQVAKKKKRIKPIL